MRVQTFRLVEYGHYVHPRYNSTVQYDLTIAIDGPPQAEDSRLYQIAERRKSMLLWLTPALRPRAALSSSCIWPVDVSRRDPALVVCFSTRSDCWTIGTDDRNLICWIDLPGLPR